jgi:immune inhibitor A
MRSEAIPGNRRRLSRAVVLPLIAIVVILSAASAVFVPTTASAMPPSPALLDRAANHPELAARIAAFARRAQAVGIDSPVGDRRAIGHGAAGTPPFAVQQAAPASGTLNTIALVVDFSDKVHQVAASSFDSLLFADVFGPGSVRGYYREVSYGTPAAKGLLDVVTVNPPSSVGWLRMPQTLAYYVSGGDYGTGTYPHNAQRMVQDAVAAADPLVDFSKYDVNGDGFVDNLVVIHAGRGAEFTGSSGDIWSHQWTTAVPISVDGVLVSSYSTEPEYWVTPGDMTTGVIAHEMGHVLGLPDLYDRDYSSEGIGDWSLMAGGSWNGSSSAGGDSPARMDAWSSAQLGWLQPQTLTSAPATRTVPAVGSSRSTSAYKVFPGGATGGSEYFLVENRRQTGTDAWLPGSGLLVWHVDEDQRATQNDIESHKLVDLEEAAGPQTMDWGADRGAPDDPYPGDADKRSFTDATYPDATTYAGDGSGFVVDQISDSSTSMTARIGVYVDATPPITSSAVLPASPDGTGGWWITWPEITLTPDETATTYYQWDATDPDGWDVYWWSLFADEGVHILYFYSIDDFGNGESPVRSLTLKTDTLAPWTSDDNDYSPHRAVTLTLSPTDDTSGVAATRYRIDGGPWLNGRTVMLRPPVRHKRSGYSWGDHLVEYYSSDMAGNAEGVESTWVTLAP